MNRNLFQDNFNNYLRESKLGEKEIEIANEYFSTFCKLSIIGVLPNFFGTKEFPEILRAMANTIELSQVVDGQKRNS